MNEYKNSKVDMTGITDKHIQTIWQTFYDILYERGELGNNQIIVKNIERGENK